MGLRRELQSRALLAKLKRRRCYLLALLRCELRDGTFLQRTAGLLAYRLLFATRVCLSLRLFEKEPATNFWRQISRFQTKCPGPKPGICGIYTRPISAACFPLAKWTEVAVVPSLPGSASDGKTGKEEGRSIISSARAHERFGIRSTRASSPGRREDPAAPGPDGRGRRAVDVRQGPRQAGPVVAPTRSFSNADRGDLRRGGPSRGGGGHGAAGEGNGRAAHARGARQRAVHVRGRLPHRGRGAVLRVHLGVGGAHQQELLRSCQKSVYQRRTVTRRKQVVMSVKKAVFRIHHLHSPSKQSSSSSRES